MHDLSDVATALYFFKINSEVSSTIMFAAQACATLAPYTKDMAAGSIRLGGVLLGQFLSPLQMFCSGLSKTPLLSYIPLCKFPPLDKIFVALIKGELNNSRHRQHRTPVNTWLKDSEELVVMMPYLKPPSSYANTH